MSVLIDEPPKRGRKRSEKVKLCSVLRSLLLLLNVAAQDGETKTVSPQSPGACVRLMSAAPPHRRQKESLRRRSPSRLQRSCQKMKRPSNG